MMALSLEAGRSKKTLSCFHIQHGTSAKPKCITNSVHSKITLSREWSVGRSVCLWCRSLQGLCRSWGWILAPELKGFFHHSSMQLLFLYQMFSTDWWRALDEWWNISGRKTLSPDAMMQLQDNFTGMNENRHWQRDKNSSFEKWSVVWRWSSNTHHCDAWGSLSLL